MLENNDQEQNILKFPQSFLWGVSTSAYQIEGGITNDWSQWEMSAKRLAKLRKKNFDYRDFVAGQACDSYNRYEEDAEMVKDLHCGAYRLGLEWSRIEPRKGEFNLEAIEHYRQVLMNLREKNIKIVLTIWHWTNPLWLVAEGGWSNKKVISYYSRYAEFVVAQLGDLVDFWVTINEPSVFVSQSYLIGKFPPNKINFFSAGKAFFNLVAAHQKAYGIIHRHNSRAKVGFTNLVNDFDPARAWFFPEIFLAWLLKFFGNNLFLRLVRGQLDYIGIDYYFHFRIVWYPPFVRNLNKEVTDSGWEIYPRGIYNILQDLRRFKKPIYIMENGIADAADAKRGKFIIDHLRYVHRAIEEGEDIRGYFYWSLLDNFEWAEGYAMKFGLYSVDRQTFQRAPRPSAATYAEICRTNQIRIEK
ncbi:MAG TPA: glycoside hydrolase family 1 protein [Candidatus Nanoarchaeia archaeon]|nr:glycoside hydrolase family 1 protein [Candidatus Nanoarchaeia archaeon]